MKTVKLSELSCVECAHGDDSVASIDGVRVIRLGHTSHKQIWKSIWLVWLILCNTIGRPMLKRDQLTSQLSHWNVLFASEFGQVHMIRHFGFATIVPVCGIRNPLTTPQHNSLDVFRTIYHPVGDDDVVRLCQTILNGNLRGVSIHEKPEIIDFNHKSMKNETNSFYTLLFRRNSTNKFHFCSSSPLAYIMLTATCRVLVKSPNWITVNVDYKLYEI